MKTTTQKNETKQEKAANNLLADEAKAFEAHRAYVLSVKALMGDANYEMMIEGV